jgi:TolB-like protein
MPDVQQIDLTREADFVLGGLEVRPRSRELVSGGKAEMLEPRIMQVLIALARRRGQVVSRGELTASCWGGRIVGEDAIYRCIQAIRKHAQTHGGFSVTTVSRIGYRLDESALPFAKRAPTKLAVLAFDNLSADPEMDWFSDGLSSEILQAVAQGADLAVIGRGSSFQFRGAGKAARKVGTKLQATHVLDGSVRRAGSRVRISAQLVECVHEVTLWSQTFERDLSDIFSVQDEIAAAVAAALRLTFARARVIEPIEPSVYDLYLRTRDQQGGFATASNEARQAETIALLAEVTHRAPAFARAWADLAMHQAVYLRRFDRARLPEVTAASARAMARTALRLDPSVGLAHQALSFLAPFAAYRERAALHQAALAASPREPEVLHLAGQFYAEIGRLSDTLDLARQAVGIDPLYWPAAQWYAGMLDAMGRHSETRSLWDAYLERWPDVEPLIGESMAGAANAGDWARFEGLAERARARGIDTPPFNEFVAYQRNRCKPSPHYLEALRLRMRESLDQSGRVSLRDLTRLYGLGQHDEAFAYAERASFAHLFDASDVHPSGPWAPGVLFSSFNESMRRDHRFVRLCAKLGLVDYWVSAECWPDCAEPDDLPYDFRAECRQLVLR